MIMRAIIVFVAGLAIGALGMNLAQRYLQSDWLGRERLHAYQRFMSYYSGRERCLSLEEGVHKDNEGTLADVRLLGPDNVGRLAELHYITCSEAREDARQGNVPADWASRADHSWTRFDESRQLLVTRMVEGLPDSYRTNFAGGGFEGRERDPVSAASRKR